MRAAQRDPASGGLKAMAQVLTFDLTTLPPAASLRSVSAAPAGIAGRNALRVELTESASAGEYGRDYVDMPTFAVLPAEFENGTISVDVLARLNGHAPDIARGFAGIAYRIVGAGDRFECVYLRPLNGRPLNPPPPRDKRAVQYFAYPDWRFERLRQEYQDGRYEAGADIAADRWINLAVHVDGLKLRVEVDGKEVLSLDQAKAAPVRGNVGLFVDIGTVAFFSRLRITGSDARRNSN
jgi:hypothetical protein